MSILCGHCHDPIRRTRLHCPRCAHLNWNHPALIVGKVLMAVTACTAVGLLIYLGIHRDEYTGTKLESLPSNEPPTIHLRRSADPEPAADAKFGER